MAGASASGLLRWACATSGTAVIARAMSSASRRCPLWLFMFMGMSFSERRVTFRLRSAFMFMDAALTRSLVLEFGRQIEPDADIEHEVLNPLGLGAILRLRCRGDGRWRVGHRSIGQRLEVVRDNVVAQREVDC